MRAISRLFCAVAAALLLTFVLSADERAAAQTVGPGNVLISEFRLSGPGGTGLIGASDEYIELYCNRDTACDISDYNIFGYDPSIPGNFLIPLTGSFVIPARGHLLVADSFGYSLTAYAGNDVDANFGGADNFIDNQGFQLRNADETVIIDSVGFIGGGNSTLYIEGTGLQRATAARPADQYAYVRRMTSGTPQDTDNNANDFVLTSVTGTAHAGITAPPVLGAPGPENTASPIRTTNVTNGFVPNVRERVFDPTATGTNAPAGTLTFQRRYTNNTGAPIGRLRIRVIDITTLNSPDVRAQFGSTASQQAILRVLDGNNQTVSVDGAPFQALSLEQPAPLTQAGGGGLNSSLVVGTFATPQTIPAGGSVDVQYRLGVQQGGYFRFFISIEAAGVPTPALPSLADRRIRLTRTKIERRARPITLRRTMRTTDSASPASKKQ